MNRRYFLLSAPAAARRLGGAPPVKITRIRLAAIEGRFHRFVAMNSYDQAPKGHTYTNTLVRLETDQGIEGVGVMEYRAPDAAFLGAARQLLGANPLEVYAMKEGRIAAPSERFGKLLTDYPHLDGPLFDLIGKLTGKPAYRLIGAPVRERIEVYDGTLYFSDVWFRDRGVKAVVEEAEEAARKGYLGVKLKIGRGWKWMEREAGLLRDIEVLKAVRKALGPKIKIMADANNGYRDDYPRVWRLLSETAKENIYWLEELFPEDVALYGRLRDDMAKAGMKILIADGENMSRAGDFAPYLAPRRLIDVLQMDIRRGGFLGNLEAASLGEKAGAVTVPHNWGSQVGLFMGLHLARAAQAVPAAEDDRSTCDVIEADGYRFSRGYYQVSEAPGLGLKVDQKAYELKYKAKEQVVA